MLTHPTLNQLRALKLDGMADAFVETQNQPPTPPIAQSLMAGRVLLLIARRPSDRNTRRFQVRLRSARLRHGQAVIEDVDYRTPRRLDKTLFQQLASGTWIAEHRNLLVTGPCGIGKSWLSSALARGGLPRRSRIICTPACRGCSQIWSSHTAMVALPVCSARSSRPISWCLTIGDRIGSPPISGAI